MDDELEDGEISGSDGENDNLKVSSSVGENKLTNEVSSSGLATSSMWRDVPVSGGGGDRSFVTASNSRNQARSKLPLKLPNSSDSESDNSVDGLEISSSNTAVAQTSTISSFPATNSCPTSDSNCVTAAKRARRNKHNIWCGVVQDQLLSSDLSSWSGLDKKLDSDRNVESYNYLKAKDDVRIKQIDDDPIAAKIQDFPITSTVSNLDDIETFGTSWNKKEKNQKDSDVTSDGSGDLMNNREKRFGRKRVHEESNVNRGPVRDRLGYKGYDENKDRSHIRASFNDEPSVVVDELVRLLREPETMKDTFTRIVQTIGVERALKQLYKTEDLEEAGGVRTLNGSRRRTPGGVYLYLLKADASKEECRVIFQESQEAYKQQMKIVKARKKQQLAQKRKELEDALAKNGSNSSEAVEMRAEKIELDGGSKPEMVDNKMDDIPDDMDADVVGKMPAAEDNMEEAEQIELDMPEICLGYN